MKFENAERMITIMNSLVITCYRENRYNNQQIMFSIYIIIQILRMIHNTLFRN